VAYRDDLAALEARHAALSADVEARERERDHAALLIAEARARADDEARLREAIAGGLTRRRRSGAIIAAAIASVALVIGVTVAALHHSRASHMERALDTFSVYVDEVCACSDAACSTRVVDELTAWATNENVKDFDKQVPDEADMKRAAALSQRFTACMQRLQAPLDGAN